MNWSVVFRNILIGAVLGAVVGLLVGFVLVALTDAVDNPFWFVSIGIVVGAAVAGSRNAVRRE